MRRVQAALAEIPLFDVFCYDGRQYRKYRNGEARPMYNPEAKPIKLSRDTIVLWVANAE